MPGADGAPLETDDDDGVVCRFVVDVAWPDAGTIRRAWSERLELLVLECGRYICAGVDVDRCFAYHLCRC